MGDSTGHLIDLASKIKDPISLIAFGLVVAYLVFTVKKPNPMILRYTFILVVITIIGSLMTYAARPIARILSPNRLYGFIYQGSIANGIKAKVVLQTNRQYTVQTDDDGHFEIPLEGGDVGGSGYIWATPLSSSYIQSDPKAITLDNLGQTLRIEVGQAGSTQQAAAPHLAPTVPSQPSAPTNLGVLHAAATEQAVPVPPSQQPDPLAPTQFWFNYQFQPQPGKRLWTEHAGAWNEQYPDGEITQFSSEGAATIDGCQGMVVGPPSDATFQVFIPQKDCQLQWVRFRHDNGQWAWLGEMLDIKYSGS